MEHNQSSKKTFFETYQTFIAIIICGLLIGGAIIISNVIAPNSGSSEQPAETKESVRGDLISVAKKIKLDKTKFAACLDAGTNKQKVTDSVTLAENSGVKGTPTFFILKRTFGTSGKVIKEKQWSILGARDLAEFETSIKNEVSPEGQPPIVGDKIVLSESDHYRGPANAEIVIVEYADIDCFYCKKVEPTIKQLLANHPEYAFVYRQSPIVSIHPFADYKAEATECAQDIGGDEAFWKLLEILAK